jgi:hypothetical protein
MRLGLVAAHRYVTGAMAIGLAALMLASGWAIADGYAVEIFMTLGAGGLCILALTQRGAYIGILLLAAMNGLPFVDTSTAVSGKLTLQDVAVIVLILTAGVWILFDGAFHCLSRAGRTISRAGILLLLWWVCTLARTVILQHIPALAAGAFVRDFAFFALLLILLPRVQLSSRDIGMLLGVLAAGVSLFAAGQILATTGIGQPGQLIHFEKTLQQSGFTRLYARMTDLVTAGLAVSVAASLLARRRRVRLMAFPVALLLMTSTIVQLTRARWIGLVVGFVMVSIWLMISSDIRVVAILRRRLALVVSGLSIAGLAAILTAPGIASGGTIVNRLLSVFTDLETGGGTVAVREAATRTLTTYLGGEWPFGLGFVPPSVHYFAGLPEGSIRDSDLGVLNAVVTMGVVGAALIYFPVVLMLIHCLRRSSAPWTAEYSWLRYGGAVWIVTTLVSSATLITLFSASGLVLTAIVMTILAHPSVSGMPMSVTVPHRQPVSRQAIALANTG